MLYESILTLRGSVALSEKSSLNLAGEPQKSWKSWLSAYSPKVVSKGELRTCRTRATEKLETWDLRHPTRHILPSAWRAPPVFNIACSAERGRIVLYEFVLTKAYLILVGLFLRALFFQNGLFLRLLGSLLSLFVSSLRFVCFFACLWISFTLVWFRSVKFVLFISFRFASFCYVFNLFVGDFVRLFTCLFVCLFVCFFICLFVCWFSCFF